MLVSPILWLNVYTRIEKYFWDHADPKLKKQIKQKLKEAPELDSISHHSKDTLDKRGGFMEPVILWLTKVVVVYFPIKVAIAGASIWSISKIRIRYAFSTGQKIRPFIQ